MKNLLLHRLRQRSVTALALVGMIVLAQSAANSAVAVSAAVSVIQETEHISTSPVPPAAGNAPLQLLLEQRTSLNVDDTAEFPVKGFHITGISVFSEEELLPVVQPMVGDNRTLIDLEAAATRIARYYRQHGYRLARAYVPAQHLDAGIVEITVLEGRYGQE